MRILAGETVMSVQYLRKYEFLLFLALLVANALPALAWHYFPTLDGAAHLYNAQLIRSLLTGDAPVLQAYFELQTEALPNWIGHFILGLFGSFLPAFLAEKVLLLIYLAGLPLAFRRLIQTIAPQNVGVSYLVFPFCYAYLFQLGFYNFSLGLVLLFFTLSFWIRNETRRLTWGQTLQLFVLLTLTYFSHLFVFALLGLVIGARIVFKGLFPDDGDRKAAMQGLLQQLGRLLLAASLPLVFFINYFLSRPDLGDDVFIATSELLQWLTQARPLIAYNFDEEIQHTQLIAYAIYGLLLLGLIGQGIRLWKQKKQQAEATPQQGNAVWSMPLYWLSCWIGIMGLYLFLPDSDGAAGYISTRLAWVSFLFLLLWISSLKLYRWGIGVAALVVLFSSFQLNIFYGKALKSLSDTARECETVGASIPANSVVLPINHSDNWLHLHFSNYLGADKPLVILDNYEAGTGYFPVAWNRDQLPHTQLSPTAPDFPCLHWRSDPKHETRPIDYVFLLHNGVERADECAVEVMQLLQNQFEIVASTDRCSLYKKASQP